MSALALQSFGFEDHLVRVLDREGAAWFVAQDVCQCLEIGRHRDAVARLDEDERGSVLVDTLGGSQQMAAVSESGLYALIFKSRKAAALRFRKWVTSEVLPTLRVKGEYRMPDNDSGNAPMVLPFAESVEDIERLRVGIALVRETRILHGRAKARQLWPVLGLPVPPQPEICSSAMLQNGVRDEGVARWIVERIESVSGWRTSARDLWDDYCEYCGVQQKDSVSRIAFGKTLSDFGYPPFHSGVAWRLGCRLKA